MKCLSSFNIRSEFSIKICARPLVKIDHVTTPHSESAVLAITHENRALLKMAARFAQGICDFHIIELHMNLFTDFLFIILVLS